MKHPFISQHPLLNQEWSVEKNGNILPSKVTTGSGKKVWWECSKSHEWEATPYDRAMKHNGCPYCSGRLPVQGTNDLASTHPNLAKQWNQRKNIYFSYETVSAGSNKKAWWICEKNHEWEATINSRASKGYGCPYCSGRLAISGVNDLATVKPELASQWHPTKNGELLPSKISTYSSKQVWWLGTCKHEWESRISSRAIGNSCPYCSNQKTLEGFNDFALLHPKLAAEWHPTKNKTFTPTQVVSGSDKIVWWSCIKGHEWEASIRIQVQGNGCPECFGKTVSNEVKTLSQYPELLKELHLTKNSIPSPESLSHGSMKKLWWKCSEGHEWESLIVNRIKGSGCPTCSNKQVLAGFNDLATLNPELALEWHTTLNYDLLPTQVTLGTMRKVWWQCSKGHEWKIGISNRSKGSGCPVCSNKQVLAGFNDLATINPLLASEWHPTKNGNLKPTNITSGSGKKVWWLASCGHEWEIAVTNRTRLNLSNCPRCALMSSTSKAEKEIVTFLKRTLNVETNTISIIKNKELDIYIPEKKIAIEFNGVYWHTEDKGRGKNYHYDKWLACKEQDIQLIQIWEDDWKRNKEGILRSLNHKLGVNSSERIFARKTNVVNLDKKTAELFLIENHVQGFSSGSHYLGLETKTENPNLVSVLVLRKEPKTDGKVLNIIRYATSANVIGGFTKLLSYAEKTYKPDSFITFSDHCISNGGLYENNGFIADKELKPDYMYVVKGERKHKFGYRLKRFKNDPELLWEEGLTESQLAKLNNLPRIWDAGKTRWAKTV